jgi:hypothetical protein
MSTFAGKWQTTFGPMELEQTGSRVHGVYRYMSTECPIEGKVVRERLIFTYEEPAVRGEGWFELTRRGRAFAGQFRPEGADSWQPWEGERIGFDGLWNSSFGPLRLIEDGDRVRGYYEVGGGSTIEGRVEGGRLAFTYQEPRARGEGQFELADDGLSFLGEWHPEGAEGWAPWRGLRIRPQPNLVWLVVIEAPWQRFLSENEYAFGNMLREFFARAPHVQVRHRFFGNEAGLRRCCRDLLYVAEPVVLVLATHAGTDGLHVDGQSIPVEMLLDSLRCAGSLRLLHFSACLLMQDRAVVEQFRQFSSEAGVAVSGYRTSVDWAASAIIEFTFLDLVLSRGLSPAEAAAQMQKLLPFAGERVAHESPFGAAGFHIVTPQTAGTNGRASRKDRSRSRH